MGWLQATSEPLQAANAPSDRCPMSLFRILSAKCWGSAVRSTGARPGMVVEVLDAA